MLETNPDGLGVLEIARQADLSLKTVWTLLHRMERDNEAVCTRPPEGIAKYDMTRWWWRLGRNWGVSVVGAAMVDAGGSGMAETRLTIAATPRYD